MCSFLVCKSECLNDREWDLEDELVVVPHTWYLLAQSLKTCLKRVGHGGYEWVEKEMCQFVEDMS